MTSPNFQKKQIAREVNKALQEGFSIDKSGDQKLLSEELYSWDDLNKLKDELGHSVVEFLGQVNGIITNREVIATLADQKDHFNKLVETFFSDINEFSHKVKDLRSQHEHRSGHVNDLTEFDLYNRISITYHSLFTELSTLITPTLSELVLVISEAIPNQSVAAQSVSLPNEATVIDVEVKNV